jgi:limonene-1,2-epoxide hydrolase
LENTESILFVRRFIETCVRADPDDFADYFTEDAIWWNSPWQPVRGRTAIRETLRRGAARMTALPWEIRHIVADGNIVMTERVDHFLVGGPNQRSLHGRIRTVRVQRHRIRRHSEGGSAVTLLPLG